MSTTEPTEAVSYDPDFNAFPRPEGATGVVVLCDGTLIWGRGLGAETSAVGEVVFNTGMTGYQEVLTDLSYAGQIITFTFPHIGNVGTNPEDIESITPAARGLILRTDITTPSNWRNTKPLNDWLVSHNLVGVTGIDTRQLTRRIRESGAPVGVIAHAKDGNFDLPALLEQARAWPGLAGMDLAKEVSCTQTYRWNETQWQLGEGFGKQTQPKFHVVAVDYGAKRNILRCLANVGCKVTVVPATATAEDILAHKPDGVFLSNGPGDPAATAEYAVPTIRKIIDAGLPLFGICLGHQLTARALGMTTYKMDTGHRGANHPVKDLQTGKVEITSQNHGFVVDEDSAPVNVEITHRSLFDGSVEGVRATDKPVFTVQYHPEASPGPNDSHYLFERFMDLIADSKAEA
jgi:carbamoyl-phosphate synthase small subunit